MDRAQKGFLYNLFKRQKIDASMVGSIRWIQLLPTFSRCQLASVSSKTGHVFTNTASFTSGLHTLLLLLLLFPCSALSRRHMTQWRWEQQSGGHVLLTTDAIAEHGRESGWQSDPPKMYISCFYHYKVSVLVSVSVITALYLLGIGTICSIACP